MTKGKRRGRDRGSGRRRARCSLGSVSRSRSPSCDRATVCWTSCSSLRLAHLRVRLELGSSTWRAAPRARSADRPRHRHEPGVGGERRQRRSDLSRDACARATAGAGRDRSLHHRADGRSIRSGGCRRGLVASWRPSRPRQSLASLRSTRPPVERSPSCRSRRFRCAAGVRRSIVSASRPFGGSGTAARSPRARSSRLHWRIEGRIPSAPRSPSRVSPCSRGRERARSASPHQPAGE